MKKAELKLCGLPAVRARWRRDPASIQRLFFDYETGRRVGVMCRALAADRKVYRCVEAPELEKVAGSVHHGGIVAVVTEAPLVEPKDAQLAEWAKKGEAVLLLDRIGNAHNLGALARSAAFFGVKHLVLPVHPQAAMPNDAAYRVAEGGLEAIKVWSCGNLAAFIRKLAAAGYEVFGAATRDGETLRPGAAARQRRLPQGQKALRRASALVLGNEEHGMSDEVAAACTRRVTLAGTGEVESLNVSVAGAVLLWELLV